MLLLLMVLLMIDLQHHATMMVATVQ